MQDGVRYGIISSMELDEECKDCLFRSQLKKVEATQSDRAKAEQFKREIQWLCGHAPVDCCAPLLMREIDAVHRRIFGVHIDYTEEKRRFNQMLLALEEGISSRIRAAADPLAEAVKYAMAANYIDYARLSDLGKNSVEAVISAAQRAVVDNETLTLLKNSLERAEKVVFLHDNCGEIVLDKILIDVMKENYPQIDVFSVVRGGDILNDVTEADALQVGLDRVATVVSNETAIPGTYLKEIGARSRGLLSDADVILSKGLGNLETLYGEGYGVFYMFMCKCEHIAKRFGKTVWDTAFVYERARNRR